MQNAEWLRSVTLRSQGKKKIDISKRKNKYLLKNTLV